MSQANSADLRLIGGHVSAGHSNSEDPSLAEPPGPTAFFALLGFALVLLANSSDSISIMTPLLADLKPVFVLACFAAAVTVAIVMSSLANSLARHPAMRSSLEMIAKLALPFLLIGIGVLIFMDPTSSSSKTLVGFRRGEVLAICGCPEPMPHVV